jgi:hypothetical protein
MLSKTKIGDCQNDGCDAKNTNCIKVGKVLYCVKCRTELKRKSAMERNKLYIAKRPSKKVFEKHRQLDQELPLYIYELDNLFSRYIRMKYADSYNKVSCFTCDWAGHWKLSDCGHFIPRVKYALRWDERNVRVQCKKCNQEMEGNIKVYCENLEKESPGITDELIEISRQVHKLSRQDMKEMIIWLRDRIKIISNKFVTE